MSLRLARHAQPLVGPGICYGATDMAAEHRATCASAGVLARQLPRGACVLSSSKQRCLQLALALHVLRPDLVHATDERLVEMDFGRWEGWCWDAIPKDAIDQWTAHFASHRFGGRESVQELMDRVAGAWRDTVANGRPTVWITHAGVIRAAMLLARGITTVTHSEQWPRESPGFGQSVCVVMDPAARQSAVAPR